VHGGRRPLGQHMRPVRCGNSDHDQDGRCRQQKSDQIALLHLITTIMCQTSVPHNAPAPARSQPRSTLVAERELELGCQFGTRFPIRLESLAAAPTDATTTRSYCVAYEVPPRYWNGSSFAVLDSGRASNDRIAAGREGRGPPPARFASFPPASEREARMDDPKVRPRLGRTDGSAAFGALDPKQEPLLFCGSLCALSLVL